MYISIKNHIILLLIVFTLIPFVLLRIIAYPKIKSDLKTVIMDNLETIGHKQTELVTTWMHERMKDALVVASNPFMAKSARITKDDKDYSKILQYLEMIVAEYGYKGAFVSNDKGLVTLATSEERVGKDISKTDFFKYAVQGRIFASSIIPSKDPLINEYGEEEIGLPTMFVAAPLKYENEDVNGVVTLRIHVATLDNLIQRYKLGKTGETYLVNRDGYMLTRSRFTKQLKKMGLIKERSALEAKMLDPETGKLTVGVQQCIAGNDGSDAKGYNDYGGISVLGAWNWLPEYDWGVITEVDEAEAYGVVYNLNYLGMALLFAIVFPVVFVAYYLGRRFSSPIVQLTEVTEKMASGDLTQSVDIKSNNEIGILATSFNTMAKALDEKTKETVESEKRYRELFNSLNEGIYQCEPGVEGVFTWVNQAGAEMFGYKSPEEMIGTKVENIYVDLEDRRKLVEKLEKDGVWKDFASFCKKKNGERFYTERTSNMVKNEEGEAVRIEGIIRDITERKRLEEELQESEEQKRRLLNSLKEGVYQCEPGVDGRFTWVNQAGAEMFGYKSPEEMIGTKVEDIYVDLEDRRRLVEKLEKDGVWRGFASFCKKKNGERFYTERTSTMVKNEEGKPVRIEGIIRDITERKRLEEELQSDIQKLRKNLKGAEKENAELKKQLKSHGWIQK